MPTSLARSSTSSAMRTSQVASATPMHNSCCTALGSFLSSAYAPIQKVLISYLEPAEFVALSSVCRQVRTGLQGGLRSTCYNIDARLSKFFTNTKEFRRVQAITGTLIDEEFALAFFMNKSPPNKLHLRVQWVFDQGNPCILSMVDFLLSDGWTPQWKLRKQPRDQWNMFWKDHTSGVCLSIDINGRVSPLCTLLNHAPTTATLSFLSWNAAYALFPRSTLIDKNAHILQDLRAGSLDHEAIGNLAKYGLKPKGLHWNHEDDPLVDLRRVGDSKTYMIDFDTSGITFNTMTPFPDAILTASTFILNISYSLRTRDPPEPVTRYDMGATTRFSYSIFRHKYVSAAESHSRQFRGNRSETEYSRNLKALVQKMTDLTKIQLMLVPKTERPSLFDETLNEDSRFGYLTQLHRWGTQKVPDTWAYYDDDLLKQLDKMWKKHEALERAKRIAMHKSAHGEGNCGKKLARKPEQESDFEDSD